MYAEIAAAVASTKTVLEIVKSASGLANFNELVAAVSEVSAKLMEATAVALASQEKQAELVAKVAELERELSRLSQSQDRMARYRLTAFSTGALAYALKDDCVNGDPMHYLCAACADKGNTTTMQPAAGKRRLWCPECKVAVQVVPEPPAQPSQRRSSGGFGREL